MTTELDFKRSRYVDPAAEFREVKGAAAWRWAIQVTETFPTEEDVRAALLEMRRQDGYLGGRYLPPDPAKPAWRLQVFFEDDGPIPEGQWLPDGCRRAIVPPALQAACDFPVREEVA